MIRFAVAIERSRIQRWDLGALVVWCWCNRTSFALRAGVGVSYLLAFLSILKQ